MEHNPFAPPSAGADEPQAKGLVFSSEGVSVVSSLATWMRALSIFYFLLVALVALGSCGTCATGRAGGVAAAFVFIIFGVGLAAAATWLRSAAEGFQRGVMSDDEFPLGQGFRSLRAYLILFGIFGLVTLARQIYGASELF